MLPGQFQGLPCLQYMVKMLTMHCDRWRHDRHWELVCPQLLCEQFDHHGPGVSSYCRSFLRISQFTVISEPDDTVLLLNRVERRKTYGLLRLEQGMHCVFQL